MAIITRSWTLNLLFECDEFKLTTLRKKCPYSEFFWHLFSRIRTEYGEIRSISPRSVRMGKMRTRITPNTDTFYAVIKSVRLFYGFKRGA